MASLANHFYFSIFWQKKKKSYRNTHISYLWKYTQIYDSQIFEKRYACWRWSACFSVTRLHNSQIFEKGMPVIASQWDSFIILKYLRKVCCYRRSGWFVNYLIKVSDPLVKVNSFLSTMFWTYSLCRILWTFMQW